jgi:hypothetical protein
VLARPDRRQREKPTSSWTRAIEICGVGA